MPPESLEEAISHDLAKGFIPFFICATVIITQKPHLCVEDKTFTHIYCIPLHKFISSIAKYISVPGFQVGTTSSAAVDPLVPLGNIAKVIKHIYNKYWTASTKFLTNFIHRIDHTASTTAIIRHLNLVHKT